jgi:ABC-2 type transport system permease protein
MVFGFIGNSGRITVRVAFEKSSDTSNPLYRSIINQETILVMRDDDKTIREALEKGRIAAVLAIKNNQDPSLPAYLVNIKTSEAVNPQNIRFIESYLQGIINEINKKIYPPAPTIATISQHVEKIKGRTYRTIDFILPGQLGFSLLSAGVFGVAFLFFNLRQTLVLKRFFATPISKKYIVLGEGLSRVMFQMITSIVILLIGHFVFKFTLVHGWVTFLELIFLSFVGLMVFMGLGFIVSGIAKNESSIPPLANLITLPQFLLAGTFFSIDAFPSWLQPVCKVLPLTHLNDAMRNIAFEGAHLNQCGKQLGILLLWGIVAYAVAVRVFRWE